MNRISDESLAGWLDVALEMGKRDTVVTIDPSELEDMVRELLAYRKAVKKWKAALHEYLAKGSVVWDALKAAEANLRALAQPEQEGKT